MLKTEEVPVRRFLFETSFDSGTGVEKEATQIGKQPPEPTFTQADLDAARQQGYRDGENAGKAATLGTIESTTAANLDAISAMLPALAAQQAAAHALLMQDGVRLAMTVIGKILPAFAARHGTAEIEALVADCLSRLPERPKISVYIPESAGDALSRSLDNLAETAAFDGRFIVHEDPAMGPADCRLEWGDGSAERNLDRLWADIETAADRYLASAEDGTSDPESTESSNFDAAGETSDTAPPADPHLATEEPSADAPIAEDDDAGLPEQARDGDAPRDTPENAAGSEPVLSDPHPEQNASVETMPGGDNGG